jgi:hypothetical protein
MLLTSPRRRGATTRRVPGRVGGDLFDLLPPRRSGPEARDDIVDEWGHQSFPASDPPANW